MTENTTDIKKSAAKLVGILSQRNREVVSRRFGLKTGKKETLEAIGASYGITRERVRQIEEASLKMIKEDDQFQGSVQPHVRLAKNIVDQVGGVMNEKSLFSAFSGSEKPSSTNAALVLMLTLDGTTKRTPEDDNFHAFWSISKDRSQEFKNSIATFISTLKQSKKVIADGVMADFLNGNASLEGITVDTVNSYISISKKVGKNVYAEIGLTSWPEIKPRGVRDKSFLVLKKEGKPRHFREITQLINSTEFSPRKAHIQTVHNELIKDDRFVLVGRGIYALSEWGYKSGTVKNVIADLIRENGPMKKDEIVAKVLSARMVKQNTVLLGMQDKKIFNEDESGYVILVEEA
ncbi:MAG: sigma factor-like helix-turn-helix DNA-binding protein [Parcubacteria group bacterium]